MLSDEQARRYARHTMLPELGAEGQQKLLDASVLVIGAGGLGAACISYLAAAGVGHIGIIDDDHVELSNLQRQILHETGDIGRLKTDSARDRISELNPEVHISSYNLRLDEDNAREFIRSYEVVADGCDNFATRFAVSDACIAEGKTLVSAAVKGFEGQLATFKPHAGDYPCYRCLVPELPAEANNCSEVGVLGPVCGVLGAWQAVEIIKEITGVGESLAGHLLRINTARLKLQKTTLPRDKACPSCSKREAA